LCGKTLKSRFESLDKLVIEGMLFSLTHIPNVNSVEDDTDLLLAWHEERISPENKTILEIGFLFRCLLQLAHR